MGAKISSRGKFRRKPSRHQKTALSGPAPLGLLLRKILLRTRKTLPPRRRHFPCNPLKKTTRKKNEASEEQRFQKPRRPIFTVIGESLSAYLQAVINIARTKKQSIKKSFFFQQIAKKKSISRMSSFLYLLKEPARAKADFYLRRFWAIKTF